MDDEVRLTPEQVQLVLRRASELDQVGATEGVSTAEVASLAAEVGLSPATVQQALAEMRSGVLAAPRPVGALERVLGRRQLVIERVVPGRAVAVQRRIERFLRQQLLQIKRHFGERVVWQHARGWWPDLRR
jgi:hypothetical protein